MFFLLICLSAACSLWLRMNWRRTNSESGFQTSPFILQESKPSRLSNAVQGLIATAGGIYLALIMIVSFLKINIPQVISIESSGNFAVYAGEISSGLSLDPLAAAALLLAIIEPMLIKFIGFIRKIDFL